MSGLKAICIMAFVGFNCFGHSCKATKFWVGNTKSIKTIKAAIAVAHNFDTIYVTAGTYKEGNILINKPLVLIGLNKPILDGDHRFEVLTIKASNVVIQGFRVQHSSYATLDDPGGIKVIASRNVIIKNNILISNFFGIYLQGARQCTVVNNSINAFGKLEQEIGNGVHAWKSDSLLIANNAISGHRDGIYFEFVTNSLIKGNRSENNIRYGLHFMFSNDDTYSNNTFDNNGAGVAVMFTKRVKMFNNIFKNNWGDAAYGLLLKEISDSEIIGNSFQKNTAGIFIEGANRINFKNNKVSENGWGIKLSASCMDNVFTNNNFVANSFDLSTNGTAVLNTFQNNYWDNYDGYDLDKNGIGDVPYRPLSIYSVLSETIPASMLLFKSMIVNILEKTEKLFPSLTPETFIDNFPLMKPVSL